MKSIVEEASSIFKAIEKAWIRAGKPIAFRIKIFEEPKRNFFGFMTQSAKVGLFFSEEVEIVRQPVREMPKKRWQSAEIERQEREKEEKAERFPEPIKERKQKDRWSQDMIKAAQDWIDQVFSTVGFADISYSVKAKGYHLFIFFNSPVLARSKELQLFRSFAHLIMQMIRTKFKRGFIGFKVVLQSSQGA